MASRRFFRYDPYDYYYTAPYHHYPYPYYHHHQQPAPARSAFFPVPGDAEPAVREAARARPKSGSRSVSIPVHFVGSNPEPERETARTPSAAAPRKRAPSAEAAAVRLQAAARGFLARRMVRAVREVEREAEEVRCKVAREAEALRGDARARIAVGEALMRLLLRLDAVRGAREYRRRVTKRVLALQDDVDALEPRPAPAPTAGAGEMEEESEVAPDLPDATEQSGVTEAAAEMEVDGGSRAAGDEQGAAEGTDPAQGVADLGGDMPDGAEGEWEMVTEEPAPAAEAESSHQAPPPQVPTAGEETKTAAESGGVDARKVMEMVAALCERNAQQCAVIGALAERVDALQRAVRRVEDAERRHRRGKKLRKEEGKASNHSECYTD